MDIYKEVTDRIIAQMGNDIIPWQKPWVASGNAVAISHTMGKPYSLLNRLMLGRAGEYVTFKQCQQEGGKVRKGEKASMVFWKWIETEDEETHEKKEVPFLRCYNVFHISQCDELTAKHDQLLPSTADPNETVEAFITDYLLRSGVKLTHEGGDRVYYQPPFDRVVLPCMEQFKETAEYYSTAFHELTHSTGHESRLNRLDRTAFFGTEAYSKEELVAEIGAAALVNHTGLETTTSFRNSAAYVQNWMNVLKNDKRFIVSVAGKEEKPST